MTTTAQLQTGRSVQRARDDKSAYTTPAHVTCVNSMDVFDSLRQDWNELVLGMREPHPFVLWEWQHSWWETYARKDKDELFILCVHDQNELIGIAPFYLKSVLAGKQLTFIGEGESRDEAVVTHYPDLVCKQENETAVVSAIARHLENRRNDWDYASFNFVLESALLHQLAQRLTLSKEQHKPMGHRYILSLPQSFDEFLSTLGKSTRKQFRLKRNRLQKTATLSTQSYNISDSIQETLNETERLHRARQHAKNERSAFDADRFVRFHQRLLMQLKHTPYPEIRSLKQGEQNIALAYNFNLKQRVYSYLSGFKSQDDRRLSPMFVFDMLEIESLIKRGFTHYDFLSTNENGSYKEKYRCETEPVMHICWFKQSPASLFKQGLLLMCNQLSDIKQLALKIKNA